MTGAIFTKFGLRADDVDQAGQAEMPLEEGDLIRERALERLSPIDVEVPESRICDELPLRGRGGRIHRGPWGRDRIRGADLDQERALDFRGPLARAVQAAGSTAARGVNSFRHSKPSSYSAL